jgi:hypothetical protein
MSLTNVGADMVSGYVWLFFCFVIIKTLCQVAIDPTPPQDMLSQKKKRKKKKKKEIGAERTTNLAVDICQPGSTLSVCYFVAWTQALLLFYYHESKALRCKGQ